VKNKYEGIGVAVSWLGMQRRICNKKDNVPKKSTLIRVYLRLKRCGFAPLTSGRGAFIIIKCFILVICATGVEIRRKYPLKFVQYAAKTRGFDLFSY
jgi:hypothetical protein